MNAANEKLKTPAQDYEEALFGLAVYQMMMDEKEKLKAEKSEADDEESMLRILRLIDRHTKSKAGSVWRASLRLLKTAALILLVLNMVLTVAATASTSVREKIIGFFMEITESHMDFGFSRELIPADSLKEWSPNYYPTYIPEGYVMERNVSIGGLSEVDYSNENGDTLTIGIYGETTRSSINMEGAEVSYLLIDDVTAIVLRQPYDQIDIIWSKGERYFMVSGRDYETTRKVAQSMREIEK